MLFRSAASRQSPAAGWWLAVALVLIVVSGYASAQAELVDRIVAILDRDVIMLSEAEQAILLVELSSGEAAGLRDVVERLIEARLIEREVARFTDSPVPDELIEERLARVRSSFPNAEALDAMLSSRGMTRAELRSDVSRQLTVNRYLERRFRALTYVTEDDIENYFSAEVLPELSDERGPTLEEIDQIRRILEEQRFNERVDQWIEGLKKRSRIRRYVW
jgi:peptidyl-prolyl cis-trans isomerase SurA